MSTIEEWEVQELINRKDDLVSGLAIYTKEVETASEIARAVYHDFTNILLSMQETISTKEVGEIRSMYVEILKKCHIGFMEHKQEVGKLSHIKVLEVKSVITAKILQAESHNSDMESEIPQVIAHLQIDNLDIVRLLGIMLDNAIDEVKLLGTTQPVVRLAIFDKGNSRYLLLKMRCDKQRLPTHLIFLDRGYDLQKAVKGDMDWLILKKSSHHIHGLATISKLKKP